MESRLAGAQAASPGAPGKRISSSAPAPGGTTAEDDRSLVARAKAADQAAFRELVDRHRDRAYGLALRILRSPPDAEEVAQDAFVRAWLALPGFRGEAKFSTWLYRIVARRAFDRAAVLKGRRARETSLEEARSVAVGKASLEAAARATNMLRLERSLDELSAVQRAVVTMYYYQERAVQQVAEALGLPEGTVKTHLHRARAALRGFWLKAKAADVAGGSLRLEETDP